MTNNYVAETHETASMFATVFIGILDPGNGNLFYINCGNDAALIADKSGKVHTELRPTGPAVGAIAQAKFAVKEIILGQNDTLLAFTDGIPDTLNINGDFFGNERLRAYLSNNPTATNLLNNIQLGLTKFIGDAEQFDDITLLALKRKPE